MLGLPVLKTAAACVLWLAVAAAAERTGHVAVGMKNESRWGDAADEKRGLFLHTQAATSLAAPLHLEGTERKPQKNCLQFEY